MKKEKAECLYCGKDFDVEKYGWRIPCPNCGKLLDILPEPNFYIHTKHFGVIGIAADEEKISALIPGVLKILARSIF